MRTKADSSVPSEPSRWSSIGSSLMASKVMTAAAAFGREVGIEPAGDQYDPALEQLLLQPGGQPTLTGRLRVVARHAHSQARITHHTAQYLQV